MRKDRRCPDLDAQSRTGLGITRCKQQSGAKACESKCASATGPNVLGFSEWPRASCSSSHVGGMSGHTANSLVALVSACWWLSLGWALVLLAFVFLYSWRWCSSLVWGLRIFFFRACGPPGRLSQRQLQGVDRNGVFTEAARYIHHLSRVWANGVLDLGDLNPLGFFTEAVRCDNCEARCTHGARARTQEPNLPRPADNLHVCGLSLHSLAR